MKIKLMETIVGPNGERFSDEAEMRQVRKGEWYIDTFGRVTKRELDQTAPPYIVLTPLAPATKVERIKVKPYAGGLLGTEEMLLWTWQSNPVFRGAVYIHPMSKSELVFSFTHPVYIRPEHRFMGDEFPWSTTRDEWHTVILWPSFIEVER